MLLCVAVGCGVVQCSAVCCSVLQCVAVCYSVLQCAECVAVDTSNYEFNDLLSEKRRIHPFQIRRSKNGDTKQKAQKDRSF